ncbi:MAG: hypothetical protein PHV06_00900 [bacterium]|nr:hypothetical protein [bacterium]
MKYYKKSLTGILLILIFSLAVFGADKLNMDMDTYILYDDFYEVYQDGLKFNIQHQTYETIDSIGNMSFETELKYQEGEKIPKDFWHLETFSIQHRHVLNPKLKLRLRAEAVYDYYYDPLFRNLAFSNAVTLYYYFNLFFYVKLEYYFEKETFTESNILDNFSHQLLMKIMKRQSLLNSYYFMLIAGERKVPNWSVSGVSGTSHRIDGNVTGVFSLMTGLNKKMFNEFSTQLEYYSSNIKAYELVNIGNMIIIELPDQTSGTRQLIDDYFNYYSRRFNNNITWLMGKNYILQFSASYILKNYESKNSRSEFGIIKDSKEWDEQQNYSLTILKNDIFVKGFSLKLNSLFQINSSNNKFNQYYLYNGNRFMFSFSAGYKF